MSETLEFNNTRDALKYVFGIGNVNPNKPRPESCDHWHNLCFRLTKSTDRYGDKILCPECARQCNLLVKRKCRGCRHYKCGDNCLSKRKGIESCEECLCNGCNYQYDR